MNKPELWPAPMDGVFSPDFLAAANELQLTDRWMTSFLRLSENLPGVKLFRSFLAPYGKKEICAQLMGRDPQLLAAGAARFLECGAASVNLNFGCPVPRVVAGGAGGAMLKEPALMTKIVSSVKNAVGERKFSVKMRCGFSDFGEFETVFPMLRDAGCDKFFIHYRTVKELYYPVAERNERLDRIAELCSGTSVILNGDFSMDDLDCRSCTGVMIGRNWLKHLGMFRELAGKTSVSGEEFCRALIRHGVGGGALRGMKKMIFGAWNYEL